MAEMKLHGSGGYVIADLTDEQAKKADLGVGRLFLAPIGRIEEGRMLRYHCKDCEKEFPNPPEIRVEERPNEEVADNLILTERGQYACGLCGSIIGEYRDFAKKDESADVGRARPGN